MKWIELAVAALIPLSLIGVFVFVVYATIANGWRKAALLYIGGVFCLVLFVGTAIWVARP